MQTQDRETTTPIEPSISQPTTSMHGVLKADSGEARDDVPVSGAAGTCVASYVSETPATTWPDSGDTTEEHLNPVWGLSLFGVITLGLLWAALATADGSSTKAITGIEWLQLQQVPAGYEKLSPSEYLRRRFGWRASSTDEAR